MNKQIVNYKNDEEMQSIIKSKTKKYQNNTNPHVFVVSGNTPSVCGGNI